MRRLLSLPLLVLFSLALTACRAQPVATEAAPTATDAQVALETLVRFLSELHNGQYAEAAELYSGTYETMIDHNPSLDPNDRVALMRNACTINGAQCLDVKTAGLDAQLSSTEFIFKVELQTDDGSLFILGPCCGASETDQPSTSVFMFSVVKTPNRQFQVIDMPPYAP
jgi:hypothetical protein